MSRRPARHSTATQAAAVLFLVLAGVLGVGLLRMHDAARSEASAVRNQAELRQLGVDLAAASDFLTREARAFAVTGERAHAEAFWHEVEERRTRDRVLAHLRLLEPTPHELALLAEAKERSDELIGTETRSMRLVYDAQGASESAMPRRVARASLTAPDMALSPAAKIVRAREIMYDERYDAAKREIMGPIEEFQRAINARADRAVAVARARADRWRVILTFVAIAFPLLTGSVLWLFHVLVGRPVARYSRALQARHADDLGFELVPSGSAELRVLARAVNEQLDARRQAITDPLTGLGNRRRLLTDLDAVFAAPDGVRRLLVLFDLDGFKRYNDTYGHAAGDALLTRLARRLEESVGGAGRAYRLGGDEFCVLLPVGAEDAVDGVVSRCEAALSEHGGDLAVRPSYGRVLLPTEADSTSAALKVADQRMYAQKDTRRSFRSADARDLLLRVVGEQQPDLHDHSNGVAEMALRVARELGMPPASCEHVAQAAELHDVGKVAIPAEILRKPGPLDEEEWRTMRLHTVIGERILSAVPSLRPVGAMVRSSHERWDGAGYPDNLAGPAIPLGARIVAVCDAFDAMTSDRPYRRAVSTDDALAELDRCAGTQFDPAVVAAFRRVLRPTLPLAA